MLNLYSESMMAANDHYGGRACCPHGICLGCKKEMSYREEVAISFKKSNQNHIIYEIGLFAQRLGNVSSIGRNGRINSDDDGQDHQTGDDQEFG
jgi:hypothetical protein